MSDDTSAEARTSSGEHDASAASAEGADNPTDSNKPVTGDGGTAATANETVRADLGVDDGAAVSLDELDTTALARRRGRTRKGRPAGRYMMCVHVREDRTTHIGVLEGRSLVEHYVGSLEPGDSAIDGNIYLGKVQNVLPGMEAAFVDIGTPKN